MNSPHRGVGERGWQRGYRRLPWLLLATLASCKGNLLDPGDDPPAAGALTLSWSVDLDARGQSAAGIQDPLANYTLYNEGRGALEWTAEASEPWVVFPVSQGRLRGQESVLVTARVSEDAARELPTGEHTATISFSKVGFETPSITREARLFIVSAALTPATEFRASGSPTDGYESTTSEYRLKNLADTPLSWRASSSARWLRVLGSSSGSLSGDQSTTLDLEVDPAGADELRLGTHRAVVRVIDQNTRVEIGTIEARLDRHRRVDGWSQFEPSVDSRIIYVSNAGDDQDDGLSQQTPKRTLTEACKLVRDGYPDWVLLERGSRWQESLEDPWKKSGRSKAEPILIASYGDPQAARPLLDPGKDRIALYFDSKQTIRHVAVVDLQFIDSDVAGIDVHGGEDLLFENCRFERCGIVVRIGGGGDHSQPISDITIRRCIVMNHGYSGIFTGECEELVIEECVLYNNGLDSEIFNHNIYMSGAGVGAPEGEGVLSAKNVVRDCFILQAGGNYGLKFRSQSHGLVEGNVFSRNRNGVFFGTHWPQDLADGNSFVGNLMIDQGNPDRPTHVRGFDLSGQQNAVIADNVITGNSLTDGAGNPAIHFDMPREETNLPDDVVWPPIANVQLADNVVYRWNGRHLNFSPAENGPLPLISVRITGNQFQEISPDTGTKLGLTAHWERPVFGESGATYANNKYYSQFDVDESWHEMGDGSDLLDFGQSQWLQMSGEQGASSSKVSYSDPGRNLGTYMTDLGLGSSYEDFVEALLDQEKGNWNSDLEASAVVNYVRAGFDLPARGE